MRHLIFLILIATLSSSISLAKGKKRHRDSHVHGSGMINIVSEGDKLSVEIEVPAHDIVGFEHWPNTKEQKDKVNKAVQTLSNHSMILKLSSQAGCQLVGQAKVLTDLVEKEGSDDHHGHDHGHDHGKKSKTEDNHSEFKASYSYKCKSMKDLKTVDFLIFKNFNDIKNLKAQAIVGSQQASQNLTSQSSMLKLGK
ncbi:MAG: DUF2796 domain-containing protein [Bdellovibrionales bacterium]|nr:DUF2796 domain-containing protein [Bdellovibrionales bacterium]NQZ19900.1 DUF2796 domain-containing protein [Bdellovibrionales bacterium]